MIWWQLIVIKSLFTFFLFIVPCFPYRKSNRRFSNVQLHTHYNVSMVLKWTEFLSRFPFFLSICEPSNCELVPVNWVLVNQLVNRVLQSSVMHLKQICITRKRNSLTWKKKVIFRLSKSELKVFSKRDTVIENLCF